MSETILSAIISACSALLVCVITTKAQTKSIIHEMDKNNELQAYQIKELDKKVNKHNNLIERVYKLEEKAELENEKIKVINHRIEDLEGYHK